MSEPPSLLRFGAYELDTRAGELRKSGELVKLPPQPCRVLALLASRSGEVVTRAEIREHVWCGDTFVDFDQGLNFCIRQIREALGDTAETPRYIETLPRRGYRFLMPVEKPDRTTSVTRLIVLPFRMLRADPETDFLTFSLPEAVTSSLSGLASLVVRSSLAAARFGGAPPDPKRIAEEADVDVVVTGTLVRSGDALRVSTQLTEVPDGTLRWSHVFQVALGDLFQVQDELTRRIVDSLSLPLTAREQQLLGSDVPRSASAYELFLRGNQLSHDSKQWDIARDLYLRSLKEDPNFAPAWARLGRIHHVMAKYVASGAGDSLERAEAAFKRALEFNPDLPIAHKLYAQLEVDLGRARDAMARLLERARSADPELFAGLVSACRYCGLLEASVAADARAHALEPRIRTSAPHTWFLRGDYERVVTAKIDDFPYIVGLSLAALGRTNEAIDALQDLERRIQTRLRDFAAAARSLIEGDTQGSLAAIARVIDSHFRDPEGLFYLTRHLAHLGQTSQAIDLFERVVEGGFYCYPAMARDSWLDPIRDKRRFSELVRQAEKRYRDAVATFVRLQGERVLGISLMAAG